MAPNQQSTTGTAIPTPRLRITPLPIIADLRAVQPVTSAGGVFSIPDEHATIKSSDELKVPMMQCRSHVLPAAILGTGVALCLAGLNAAASPAVSYRPIVPSMSDTTVVLTGRDLTIDQVVQVARYS